ncbi:MAG: SDR family oxidoreductase [Chloroflexota bacterium]
MDLGLTNSVALVAASSQGIGRSVAEVFAREGARVVINGRREDVLQRTAEDIRRSCNAEVEPVLADLSRARDCRRLIERTVERFGKIDALVTNAGGPPSKSFEDLTDEDWQSAVDLTLMSTVRLIRAAMPHMRASGGSIVNLTSISVKQPIAMLVLSNSLRPGVTGLGKTLADELGSENVRINSVAPGLVWTDRQQYLTTTRAQAQGVPLEDVLRVTQDAIPLKRYGTPEEVANLVVFLSSPRAAYITGTTILVDGGMYRGLM